MNVGTAERTQPPDGIAPTAERPPNSRTVNALVFACPFTASFSSTFGAVPFAGQSWYPFKIVVPALAIVLGRRVYDMLTQPGSYPFLLAVLAAWGGLGLYWTPDTTAGLTEVSVLVFAAIATGAIAIAVRTPDGVRWLLRGWVGGLALTFVVALWELGSGQHLPSDFVDDFGERADGLLLATFGNPNNFGAFMVISLPFIAIVATNAGTSWGLGDVDRAIARVLLALLPIMLLLSGSRFALVGAVFACCLYIVLNHRDRTAWRLAGILAVGGTAVTMFAIATAQQIVNKFGNLSSPSAFNQNSVEIRVNLILNGFSFVGRTAGIGIGPAGYEKLTADGDVAFPVRRGVVNPHNFWIEFLSQYGVIGGLLLGVVFLGVLSSYLRVARDRPHTPDRRIATLMIAGLGGYFFASMTGSSYINASENWMFVASFVALTPAVVALGRSRPTEPSPAYRPSNGVSGV